MHLYYLNNAISLKKKVKHSLAYWQNIMGYINVNDILQLDENVQVMQITDKNEVDCEIC